MKKLTASVLSVVLTASFTLVSAQKDSIKTQEIEGVVVTALGIKREKKSLGYATQEIKGDDLNGGAATGNVTNLLSGKAAGVEIRRNTNLGGSTNVVIRGTKSVTGNNQALWVIDGVPIDNANTNSTYQQQGGAGFDYGNAASDINQEDIESINILKGAAATALYGSRAANGAVIITTKKGKRRNDKIGITFSTEYTNGSVDKSTFAKYQNEYGAGYGPYYDDPSGYFLYFDVNGDGIDDLVQPTSEDASYGAAFSPNLMVYQWNAFTPYSSNFGKATPWTAAKNGPGTFFKNSHSFANSVTIENGWEKSNILVSYSNLLQTGILPNSELRKNQLSGRFSQELSDRLTANIYASVTLQDTKGRNNTGYSGNIMTMFRQWWPLNVDVQELRSVYENSNGQNVTWNWSDPSSADGLKPIYWNNPYFERYQNYQTDNRNRWMGYASLQYKVTDWMNILGRVSIDTYNALQEERKAVGSIAESFGLSPVDESSGYQRFTDQFKEINYDVMANFNKKLSEDISLTGVLGTNIRRVTRDQVLASTLGGLVQPGLYALGNSRYELPFPAESTVQSGVNGYFAQASLGYKDTYFLDGSIRRDASSTLPSSNNSYWYPAVSGAIVFSNLIGQDWLSFGKLRANYAEVGNDAPPQRLITTYNRNFNFHGFPSYTLPNTLNYPNLQPERTKSMEAGIEASFFNKRVGIDVAYYDTRSFNQIIANAVSGFSGATSAYINGGEIQNKGVEVQLNITPLKSPNFAWDINLNWSKNNNKVLSLPSGTENIQLGAFQQGVTINATVGQPYGTIQGTDFVYLNGQKVVNATSGRYLMTSTSNNLIGNINPDWIGGIRNRITYKNVSLSFLIDAQKGGDIFSLDMAYGLATGLYPETVGNNGLGQPIREGGIILPGVNPNGNPNATYTAAPDQYGNNYGYRRAPNAAFIYDASFIKLREAALTIAIPKRLYAGTFIDDMKFSIIGTNLWIIHKNLPYADPESGLSSGNLARGYSVGSLPTTRDIGVNFTFKF